MARRRKTAFSNARSTIDEVAEYYIDSEEALNSFYGWLFMDSRLVRIFCANLPSQQAREASYNLLFSLRKGYLFRHRSWCYRLPSSSTSPESIKSLMVLTYLPSLVLGFRQSLPE